MSRPLTHREFQDLLPGYALGALDEPEHQAVEAYLDAHPAARRELDEYQRTVDALPAPASPPDQVWERIAEEVGPKASRSERIKRKASALGAWLVGSWPRRAALAAAAAIVAIAIAVPLATDGDDQPVAALQASVMATDQAPGLSGEAHLFDPHQANGTLVLDLADVPAAPAGHHYLVWVLREGSTVMEAVGAFSADDPELSLELRLPGPGDYHAVDISLQEDGQPAEHSGISIASAALADTQ